MTATEVRVSPSNNKDSQIPHARPFRINQLIWLTWRQHRAIVLTTAALALIIGTALITLATLVQHCGVDNCDNQSISRDDYEILLELLLDAVFYFPAFVAVFWGAPLITREYEQRTQLIAWGGDLSPRRWLLSKALLLAIAASFIAVALWLMSLPAIHYLQSPDSFRSLFRFDRTPFGINPLTLIPHTIFGLACGIALGAILRRTIPALALSLVAVIAIQLIAAIEARPHWYLPSTGVVTQLDNPGPLVDRQGHFNGIVTGSEEVNSAGKPVDVKRKCSAIEDFDRCRRENGVTAERIFIHSSGQMQLFRLIEAGYLAIMTAGALTTALYCIRRRRLS